MNSSSLILSLSILVASFWGSWHCAAMCGPVASLMAHKNSLLSYHFGRGLGYIAGGALGGYLGSVLLTHEIYIIRFIAGITFAFILFLMALQIFFQGKLSFPHFYKFKFVKFHQRSSFMIGLLSLFLPCGWLYSYIIAAMATQSTRSGALVMSLFWLGSLPALSSISIFFKKSIRMAPLKKQKIAGAILVFASLYSLFSFFFIHP